MIVFDEDAVIHSAANHARETTAATNIILFRGRSIAMGMGMRVWVLAVMMVMLYLVRGEVWNMMVKWMGVWAVRTRWAMKRR